MHPELEKIAAEVFEELKSMPEIDFKKEMELHAILKMKTVMITLTKEDEEGNRYAIRLSGDEAAKWSEAINSQGSLCYAHGIKFPELKWEVI